MDSDDESLALQPHPSEKAQVIEVDVKKKRGPKQHGPVQDAVVVLTKDPKKKRVMTPELKEILKKASAKGLEKLTEIRREKAKKKEEEAKEMEEVKQVFEMKKLDAAPKVKEIDSSMTAMRKEMDELKKTLEEERNKKKAPETELAEKPTKKKIKKIIYEEESSGEEEVVKVVRKKSEPKPPVITGTALLDKLFFN